MEITSLIDLIDEKYKLLRMLDERTHELEKIENNIAELTAHIRRLTTIGGIKEEPITREKEEQPKNMIDVMDIALNRLEGK